MNDATSIVLFNSVQKINVDNFNAQAAATIILDFMYLFFTSTCLGVAVSVLVNLLFLRPQVAMGVFKRCCVLIRMPLSCYSMCLYSV